MRVLFVCTGNVFRSMAAEKCLKAYLRANDIKGITVDSAGTAPFPQQPQPATIERLGFYGIPVSHAYKKVTRKLVAESDVVIAINTDHQTYLKERFGVDAPLFDEAALGVRRGIPDFEDARPDIGTLTARERAEVIKKHAYFVVDHIHAATPKLADYLLSRT